MWDCLKNNPSWKDVNTDCVSEFLMTFHENFVGGGIYKEMSYYGAVRIDNNDLIDMARNEELSGVEICSTPRPRTALLHGHHRPYKRGLRRMVHDPL